MRICKRTCEMLKILRDKEFTMIVKTYWPSMDRGGCGILPHGENGKITKIKGDFNSPISDGALYKPKFRFREQNPLPILSLRALERCVTI